jgi:hypothetical protein
MSARLSSETSMMIWAALAAKLKELISKFKA